MRIAITGASGFIGQEVVKHAIAQGHEVLAITRSKPPQDWQNHSGIQHLQCDLLNPEKLENVLGETHAVIHLAALMSGDNQISDTLKATQNLLNAMDEVGVNTLVALGSIASLDYTRQKPYTSIDENIPTNGVDNELGSYAIMKREQEATCKRWHKDNKRLIILRPGLVYDQTRLSDAHAGFKVLASSHQGEVPVVHVSDVADACIKAVDRNIANGIFHLVNDDLPKQKSYIQALKKRGKGATLPLPWYLYSLFMSLVRLPLQLVNRVPDSFRKNSIAARQKPFFFSNALAKKQLQWQPRKQLED